MASAPATPCDKSATGTHGGVFMAHLPWMNTAIPFLATGGKANIYPAKDIIWKYVRLQGLTVTIAFAYFKCSVGLSGPNQHLIDTIHSLSAQGPTVVAADFNVPPEQWHNTGLLSLLNMQIITPHHGTCRTNLGWSKIDYPLVSTSIAPLIHSTRTISDVPWSPHLGLAFTINSRPRTI